MARSVVLALLAHPIPSSRQTQATAGLKPKRESRNSVKYVASKNHKAFMADLKPVYKAATLNVTFSPNQYHNLDEIN